MRRAVREQPVDNDAANREDEDKQAPEQLVQGRAVGFEDLDCWSPLVEEREGGGVGVELTPDDDVEDEDDEAEDSAAGAVLLGGVLQMMAISSARERWRA